MEDLIIDQEVLKGFKKRIIHRGDLLNSRKNNELDAVLKYHLIIEEIINKIIERELYKPEIISGESSGFGFIKKLKILDAIGIFKKHPKLVEIIISINKLRNSFAHDLNKELSNSDIDMIVSRSDSLRKYLINYEKWLKEQSHSDLSDIFISFDEDEGDEEKKSVKKESAAVSFYEDDVKNGVLQLNYFIYLGEIIVNFLNKIYSKGNK